MDILNYTFFQNALLGAFLASILCGFIGTYIVTRRLVFISGGITHASFGGIGIGVFAGLNPILSAMFFAILSAFGVQWVSRKKDVRKDSAIAMFWTLGMSVGIICCFLTPGFMPDLPSFLFGSILAIDSTDLWILAVLTLIVGILFMLLWRPIQNIAFDSTFARSQHLPVTFIEYLMMILIAMTIVSTLKMVGIVLALSLLTIPQMTANLLTNNYKKIIALSIILGWIDCGIGLYTSYMLNVPSGATIIFVSIIVFALTKICKSIRFTGIVIFTALLCLTSCSAQKNTAQSRWWQAFNAKYNTYYNGTLAYIDGSLEKEEGNKDNYTEQLPLYTVGNKASRELGKANFDRAIEKSEKAIHQHSIKRRPEWNKNRKKTAKDIEWLSRKEYNPFLWKAWMLMGRSQFYKGDFEMAASTFSYMSRLYSTQPAIYGKARAWLAKCYIEQDWIYDAEDVIHNMQRDSIHWRAQKEWDYTLADYYIHTGDAAKAIPYLHKVISHEMRRKQKAREWYLMGQLQASIGNKQEAYKAFKHVTRLNPPYELDFNARISMTEVLARDNAKKMIGKLKRMAASDNNKDYLDQVYYAIGNIHLSQRDTLQAIAAYEKGNQKATRNGIEKGVLLLHLGDLYWNKEKYADAQRCYGEAIGLLDKDRKDYKQLADRSKVLDELVPYTDAVALQDSLQGLAQMNEKDRNAAIDRVITALKKKEKEERNRQAEQEANQRPNGGNPNGFHNTTNNRNPINANNSSNTNGQWYFYSPLSVSQGKTMFQRQWGKRDNVDNWQRINKTVVATAQGAEEMTDEIRDSLANEAILQDSLKQIADSAQNDPHKREYYLAQIPFTPEQMVESNKLLEDGLFHSGVIFKDNLDNLALSEKALRRLVDKYPDYEHMDDVYYHLYLLYARKGMMDTASTYVEHLKKEYPESQWTTLITDPYYIENSKIGEHLEDSLYTVTYQAFKDNQYNKVQENQKVSETRFPTGANRDKFIFIGGLSKLNEGDTKGCLEDFKKIVNSYPNSRLSEMAGMIINGLNAGKRIYGGKFDLSNVWTRRSEILSDKDSTQQKAFSADRNANFIFMLAYAPDSLNENQLLFEMAKYNFTSYLARNFDINIEDVEGLHRMEISGFRNFDEARQYANEVYKQAVITRILGKARAFVISAPNLELIGTHYSYDDYDKFYAKHFAPLKVNQLRLLIEPTDIGTAPSSEDFKEETEESQDLKDLEPDNFLNNLEIQTNKQEDTPANLEVPTQKEEEKMTPTKKEDELEIPADKRKEEVKDNNSLELPVQPTEKQEDNNTLELPAKPAEELDNSNTLEIPATNDKKKKEPADDNRIEIQPQQKQEVEDTGIDFEDKKSSENELDDEYIELDGF